MPESRYDIMVKRLLESHETMALTLYIVLSKKYGEEWLSWEPLTVYLELRDDFSCEPSTVTMDRINAVQLLMTSSSFYTDLYGFTGICNTLSEGSPSFSLINPVTVAEAAWAVTEAGLIREPEQFAPTIRSYIQVILEMEGLAKDPPEILADVVGSQMPDPNSAEEYADMVLYKENLDLIEQFIDENLGLIVGQLAGLGLDDEFMAALRSPEEVQHV